MLRKLHFEYQAVRPATGGVRKITALFKEGQVDLVVVPLEMARHARGLFESGCYRHSSEATAALNEVATCLKTGYRFLKGEQQWSRFYSRVAEEMPGVRLSDAELITLAQAAVVDFVWVLQKTRQGELIAAQHVLHRQLSETNLRLFRELRLRVGMPLPSFGLGRRLEALTTRKQVAVIAVNARLVEAELRHAATHAIAATQALMKALVPVWRAPSSLIRRATRRHFGSRNTPAPR